MASETLVRLTEFVNEYVKIYHFSGEKVPLMGLDEVPIHLDTRCDTGFFAYPPEKVYSTSQTVRMAWS